MVLRFIDDPGRGVDVGTTTFAPSACVHRVFIGGRGFARRPNDCSNHLSQPSPASSISNGMRSAVAMRLSR